MDLCWLSWLQVEYVGVGELIDRSVVLTKKHTDLRLPTDKVGSTIEFFVHFVCLTKWL